MPRRELYREGAEKYQRLVAREDYRSLLIPAVDEICHLSGKSVVELGAGTGRLTLQLASKCLSILGLDIESRMLEVARKRADGVPNCSFQLGDNRCLPVETGSADLVIEGWSLAQMARWSGDAWQKDLAAALGEMERVCRAQGNIVLIETLGTMEITPKRMEELQPIFETFELEWGFHRKWVRTDYRFESQEEAFELISFFFGEEMDIRVDSPVVPECTGIWYKPVF